MDLKLAQAAFATIRLERSDPADGLRQRHSYLVVERPLDSTLLCEQLAHRGIVLTHPHRKNLSKPPTWEAGQCRTDETAGSHSTVSRVILQLSLVEGAPRLFSVYIEPF